MMRWQFQVLNLLFMVIAQTVLLAHIAIPALTACQHQPPSLAWVPCSPSCS